MNVNNLLNADNVDISEDDACRISCSVWGEVMNDSCKNKHDTLVTFEDYMASLHSRDKDFEYQILRDVNGEITGCLWMTSTMRKNFELFGSFICVDAMKRGINTLLWPYIATTMYNEMGMVCTGCEGIVISEREDAYKALIDFQLKFSRRERHEIAALSADGFLNQSINHRFMGSNRH